MKNILIANDDGIDAPGIAALVQSLSEVANVYIVAPDGQRSCSGHKITMNEPVIFTEVKFEGAVRAFKTTGYPADCVNMGMDFVEDKLGVHIDCVFTGINLGPNVGTDAIYSGTIAGALEAGILGKTSVAVSMNSYLPADYTYAGKLAVRVFKAIEDRLDEQMMLSVNVPNIPEDEIKGVKVATMGDLDYDVVYSVNETAQGVWSYEYSGIPIAPEGDDLTNDVIAIKNGYATITPITFDITDEKALEKVRSLGIAE